MGSPLCEPVRDQGAAAAGSPVSRGPAA